MKASRDMADHTGFTRFRARFESALEAYRQTTGLTLTEHPLAVQLQSCRSIESITTILTRSARASTSFSAESDRIITSIKCTVSMLFTLSATASFGDAIGLVRNGELMASLNIPDRSLQPYPPAKALLAGLAILIAVCVIL
jgi:hypothetical protein